MKLKKSNYDKIKKKSNFDEIQTLKLWWNSKGFSLEHPQGVGIVGIVGIEFCHPEPRPTPLSVLVDISCYSYLKEQKIKVYTFSFPII